MSFSAGESSAATGDPQDFNKFFGEINSPSEAAKTIKAIPKPSVALPESSECASYCASWVNDQSFEILPTDEENRQTEFSSSPLSDSVHSCLGFNRKKERKRRTSGDIEQTDKRKRTEERPSDKITFASNVFDNLARVTAER